MGPIRLLIGDGSVVARQLLKKALEKMPGLEVVSVASNGLIALKRIQQYRPDVVMLALALPELDGLGVLSEIRRLHGSLPVIVYSELSESDFQQTLQARSLGADAYISTPSPGEGLSQDALCDRLLQAFMPHVEKLVRQQRPAEQPQSGREPRPLAEPLEVIGIAASTGGPNALASLLPALPADLPVPVLIIQHMPPHFTHSLAERLDRISALRVCEAQSGMVLEPGCAYVAPGDHHLGLRRSEGKVIILLHQQPPENACRPAADVTFRAIADIYGPAALAVVLTGMGQDGLRGSEAIVAAGGRILAQDEASSTVWGMPGHVARAGLAEKVQPPAQLAAEISRLSTKN